MNLRIEQLASGRTGLLCVWLMILSTGTSQADWPLVRGDGRASGVAATALPTQLEVLWKVALAPGGIEATAILAKGAVYVGDVEGTFHARRLSDGSELWQSQFAETGFATAAAYSAERLFVTDFDGVIRCLDAAKGEELWSHSTDSAVYAAPNVIDGQVLVATDSGQLIALAADSGQPRWTFELEAPLRCWPTVVSGQVLLAGCDENLHTVDATTSQEVDRLELDGPTGSTAAELKGNVYFGTQQGTFYSLATQPLAINWLYRDPKRAAEINSAAAVDPRVVVFASHGKQVTALDPARGEPLWRFPVRGRVEGSPVIAGNWVLVATSRGRLIAVDLQSGKEAWSYDAGGGFLASPAVASGRLVIGNRDGTLYCFGTRGD